MRWDLKWLRWDLESHETVLKHEYESTRLVEFDRIASLMEANEHRQNWRTAGDNTKS